MRKVTTEYGCDRCGETKLFRGVVDRLPSHWYEAAVGDPPAGERYTHRRATICHQCRISLDNWFNQVPA